MKKEVYKDDVYETSMKAALGRSQKKLENLLLKWQFTKLGDITTTPQLYELIWNPDVVWNENILRLRKEPEGLTPAQAKKYQERLQEPDSRDFFKASQDCQQDPYCLREQSVFELKNGEVVFGPGANQIIKTKSVYASNERQQKTAEEILKLKYDFNGLNERCNGTLSTLIQDGEMFVETEKLQSILDGIG